MTMSTVWRTAKAKAERQLSVPGIGNAQLARNFVAGFDGGLSKQLDAFDAAKKLSDIQKAGTKATETIRAYLRHITRQRQILPNAGAVCETMSNILASLEELITKRCDQARKAVHSASMTLGSMRTYWKGAKKKIEEQVKRSADAVDVAGVKRMLAEFDGGLGKELDAFEAAYPDLARMRQSDERIQRIIKHYRSFVIAKKETKPEDKEASSRLAKDLQGSLTDVFDGIDEHISGLIKDLAQEANRTFWSVSPAR